MMSHEERGKLEDQGALYGGGGVWDEFGFGRKSLSQELVYKTCGHPYLKKTYFKIFKYESSI